MRPSLSVSFAALGWCAHDKLRCIITDVGVEHRQLEGESRV